MIATITGDRVSILADEATAAITVAIHRRRDGDNERAARAIRQAIRHLEDAERALLKSAGRKR